MPEESMPITGRKRGAPRKLTPEDEVEMIRLYHQDDPKLDPADVARNFGVSRQTLFNVLARHKAPLA